MPVNFESFALLKMISRAENLQLYICTALLILALVVYTIRVLIDNQNYWKSRGIPGPPGTFLFGNLFDAFNNKYPMVLKTVEWTKKYGKVYGIGRGLRKMLVVSDPEMLHEVFVKKFEYFHGRLLAPIVGDVDVEPRVQLFNARGSRWKRLRAISNPVFSVSNLKKILPTMEDSAQEMCKFLSKKAETGETFNIHPHFHEFTMDVISRVAMGQKGTKQFNNPWVDIAKRVMESGGSDPWVFLSWLLPNWTIWYYKRFMYAKMALFGSAPFLELFKALDSVVKERRCDREREDTAKERQQTVTDFIDLFLDAESPDMEQDENYGAKVFEKANVKIAKKLSTIEVTIQCFLFVLAGFDTTANSLAFSFYYLARNPEVQERLYQEIVDVIGQDTDAPPTFEQLSQLKYADAVMREALRLQPIAAFALARQCAQSVQVGDYWIEEGTFVQADVFSVHRDPNLWGSDATQFRPGRWFDLSPAQQSNWLAFGAGPRTCIGMRMAIMEEKLALVHILRRFIILPAAPEKDEPLRLVGTAVLYPLAVSIRLSLRCNRK